MVEINQFDLLSTFFSEKLKCEKSELTEDTDLTLFEGYNSMLVVELILYIEENIHIEIPDEYFGLENYGTIGSIINVLNKIK
ncbi:MAG: hypothetical protein K0R09_811 [Clostridiales bacterium]|jgi:acyl carrier protein|nr:hypothetical protein [Clostridiales bacterium]